ncbi:protein ARV1 [Trypanosoma theileri]|uniref:Protein ARV n=1 Tax=Trypanosoma theileri TaxID=67003 RepID=A0A1X0NDC9_9TRYP|nr:protein ARV1 [Trypanosoma theileri]ORC79831.1 protein ARV1 [Trypanosoma theileri]
MPRCIECGFDIARIVHPETEMVEKCPTCGRCCDKYYEFACVQKWIDVAILERRAWIHVVFNQTNILPSLLLAALISCLVEAYVVRTTSVYALLQRKSVYLEKSIIENTSTLESLQIVRNLRPDMIPLMMYWSTWPALFLYACTEYLLSLVAAIWLGVQLKRGVDGGEDDAVMITWAKSVSLAHTAKLGYLLFLVWRIPIPLVVVVDFVFLLWTIRGFSITANHTTRFFAFIAVSVCLLTRVIFRHVTGWSPQLIF